MRNIAAVSAALTAAVLVGCSTSGSFEGRLVDGLTGEPVPNARILLKSSDTTDLTCMTFDTTADEAGNFSFLGTCAGATYTMVMPKEFQHWQITGLDPINGGEASTGVQDVTLWHAPSAGVYLLGDEAKMIRTAADLDTVKIWKTDEEVRYPESIPKNIALIGPGQHLLIAGKDNLAKLRFHPLVPSDERRFGTPEHYFDMNAWSYIGVKFESDTEYERVTATLDEAGITKVDDGDFQAHFLSDKALPPGRYALLGDKDRRTYIVDFGQSPAAEVPKVD